MRAILVTLVLAIGCGGGAADSGDPCNPMPYGHCVDGLTCTYHEDGGLPLVCVCQGEFLVCNSCPGSSIGPPVGVACTAGESCVWNTWEHGCACDCGSDGRWGCVPQTVGTTECGQRDAGV